MRINRYVAAASGLGRRKIDRLIEEGRIKVDGRPAIIGQDIGPSQSVSLDGRLLSLPEQTITIMLNKPTGYVVSKEGQGALTVYSLLPKEYQSLKPIGRLDKDSSGLLLLSSDGQFIHQLAHPSFGKQKVYEVSLSKKLQDKDLEAIRAGIKLPDGLSKMAILKTGSTDITVALEEGRNRQIRRTFEALGLPVTSLKRIAFGSYKLGNLLAGNFKEVKQVPSGLLELTNV